MNHPEVTPTEPIKDRDRECCTASGGCRDGGCGDGQWDNGTREQGKGCGDRDEE